MDLKSLRSNFPGHHSTIKNMLLECYSDDVADEVLRTLAKMLLKPHTSPLTAFRVALGKTIQDDGRSAVRPSERYFYADRRNYLSDVYFSHCLV